MHRRAVTSGLALIVFVCGGVLACGAEETVFVAYDAPAEAQSAVLAVTEGKDTVVRAFDLSDAPTIEQSVPDSGLDLAIRYYSQSLEALSIAPGVLEPRSGESEFGPLPKSELSDRQRTVTPDDLGDWVAGDSGVLATFLSPALPFDPDQCFELETAQTIELPTYDRLRYLDSVRGHILAVADPAGNTREPVFFARESEVDSSPGWIVERIDDSPGAGLAPLLDSDPIQGLTHTHDGQFVLATCRGFGEPRLIVGHPDDGFALIATSTVSRFCYNSVHAFERGGRGELWANSSSRVDVFVQTGSAWTFDRQVPTPPVREIIGSPEQGMFAHDNHRTVHHIEGADPDQFVEDPLPFREDSEDLETIVIADGRIYAGTGVRAILTVSNRFYERINGAWVLSVEDSGNFLFGMAPLTTGIFLTRSGGLVGQIGGSGPCPDERPTTSGLWSPFYVTPLGDRRFAVGGVSDSRYSQEGPQPSHGDNFIAIVEAHLPEPN